MNKREFLQASTGLALASFAVTGKAATASGALTRAEYQTYVDLFNANDPGLPLLLFLMVIGVTVLGLLMVVMRALLRQATTLRTDMEAVI